MAISISLPEFPKHPGLETVRASLARAADRSTDREFARLCAERADHFWNDFHELNRAYGTSAHHRTAEQAAKLDRFEQAGLDAFDLLACVGWFENCEQLLKQVSQRQQVAA